MRTDAERQQFIAEASRVLAASLDHHTTIATVARLAVPALADIGVVDLLEADGSIRRLAVASHDPADAAAARMLQKWPPDSTKRVIAGGKAELFTELGDEDLVRAACSEEHLAELRAANLSAYICVPLTARGETMGALTLLGTRGRRYTEADLQLADDLARRAALAVDNARLYGEAQTMRAHALALARRAALLDHATRLLTSSLDHKTTLSSVAQLLVTTIADWCVVHVAEADGTLRRLDIAHADPAHAALARSLELHIPAHESANGPLRDVLETGRPVLAQDVRDAHLAQFAYSSELLRLMRAVQPRSAMLVPLRARGRALGALTIVAAGERRFGEDDLQLAEELAARAALAVDNAILYAEAQAACRSRDEFIATVSHELRTPLASLLLWAQLLEAGQLGKTGEARAIRAIQECAQAQSRLIEDLLDVARIASGKLQIAPRETELEAIVHAAIDEITPAANEKKLNLHVSLAEAPETLRCDPMRLRQVVINLLSNAVKFTSAGGHVWLEARRVGGSFELEVRDDGIGIEASLLPYVFERFRQGGTSRRHGGLGLGLTIVRHLVELHGGNVRVRSDGPGRGACFLVTLPLGTAARGVERHEEEEGPPAALRDVRVLVVDDEPHILEVVSLVLESHGAKVATARSARDALAAIAAEVPDVLVSDIAMPDEDGYSLIRKVRALEGGAKLPAAALTALARPEDRARALDAGYQAHIPKPIDMDQLTTVLARLVSRCPRMEAALG